MFSLQGIPCSKHTYCLAATGLKMRSRDFTSRERANQAMYDVMSKNGLTLQEVYDDKHFKTYICDKGVRFYVSRVF